MFLKAGPLYCDGAIVITLIGGPDRVDFEDAIPVATTRTAATVNARAMPRRRRPLRPLPDVMPTTKAPPFLAKGAERCWTGGRLIGESMRTTR